MRQYGEGLEKVENEKSCRERAVKCRCRTHIYRYVTLWHRREMNSVKSQAHITHIHTSFIVFILYGCRYNGYGWPSGICQISNAYSSEKTQNRKMEKRTFEQVTMQFVRFTIFHN